MMWNFSTQWKRNFDFDALKTSNFDSIASTFHYSSDFVGTNELTDLISCW